MFVFYLKKKMRSVNCGNNLQSASVSDASILQLNQRVLCRILKKKSSAFDKKSRGLDKSTKLSIT